MKSKKRSPVRVIWTELNDRHKPRTKALQAKHTAMSRVELAIVELRHCMDEYLGKESGLLVEKIDALYWYI